MQTNHSDRFLRQVLFLDAATCTACGLSMSLGAGQLGQLMNLPGELLSYAGLSLFPVAAFLAWVRARALHSGPALTVVIGGNLAWAAASAWLLFGGAVAPNAAGQAFIATQALLVLGLTAAELRGLSRLGEAVNA